MRFIVESRWYLSLLLQQPLVPLLPFTFHVCFHSCFHVSSSAAVGPRYFRKYLDQTFAFNLFRHTKTSSNKYNCVLIAFNLRTQT